MSCQDQFPNSGTQCSTIQVIAPDRTTLVTGNIGSVDPALDESGSTPVPVGIAILQVLFTTPKATANYRFEYLYVDALGTFNNPSNVPPVVVNQTMQYFTVDLAGTPPGTGYILRWRVFVVDVLTDVVIDAPESLRLQLPVNAHVFTAVFVNLRSNTDYGFSELRVENLIDPASSQRLILAQVVNKSQASFAVALSAAPDNTHYFLVARTP